MNRITLLLLCLCVILPCFSRSKSYAKPKTPVVFVFNAGDDAFRVDVKDNQQSYNKMLKLLKSNPRLGKRAVRVEGFCKSKQDLQMAKIRSNRLKACFISAGAAKEWNFATSNRVGRYVNRTDVVVVTLMQVAEPAKPKPAPVVKKEESAPAPKAAVVEPEPEPTPEPEPQQPAIRPIKEEEPEEVEEVIPAVELQPATPTAQYSPWYAGVSVGLPFGVGTFTSFAEDKTRVGFSAGLLGGYKFNDMISLEAGINFGRISLGSSKCCSAYYLGDDGVTYNTPVAGKPSESFTALYSSVFVQQYAIRLNVDVTQIICPNPDRKLSVNLSPAISFVGSKATLKNIESGNTLYEADFRSHFGGGFDISAGYLVTDNMTIRLSSGLNFLTGSSIDGMQGGDHCENLLWNNNLSLIWRFGK